MERDSVVIVNLLNNLFCKRVLMRARIITTEMEHPTGVDFDRFLFKTAISLLIIQHGR